MAINGRHSHAPKKSYFTKANLIFFILLELKKYVNAKEKVQNSSSLKRIPNPPLTRILV